MTIALAPLVPANDPRIQVYNGAQGAEVFFTASPNDGTVMYKQQSGRVAMAVPITVYRDATYLIKMDWRAGTTDAGGPFSSATSSACRAGSMIAAHTDSWCAPHATVCLCLCRRVRPLSECACTAGVRARYLCTEDPRSEPTNIATSGNLTTCSTYNLSLIHI